jgi:hypothetical protein
MVDSVIQANCVPDDITEFTSSAVPFGVTVQAAIEVPITNVAVYLAAAQAALAAYFAVLPIGGIDGAVQYNDVIGVLYAAGIIGTQASYVQRITLLLLNGVATDLAYPGNTSVAFLSSTPSLNVVGV